MINTIVKYSKPFTQVDSISTFKCLFALTNEVVDGVLPLIQVRETDGNTEEDIYALPNNKLNQEQLTDHCGSEDGMLKTWYDLKGFSDFVQSTPANQMKVVNAGVVETQNGEPCVTLDNVNDYMIGSIPFADDQQYVSVLLLYTNNADLELDNMIASAPNTAGLFIQKSASNTIRVQTKRTGADNVVTSDTAVGDGETALIGVIVDRTNIKIYINGVLDKTGTDDDSDFKTTTAFALGATSSGGNPAGINIQFMGVLLTDESNNMSQFYDELSTRYNNTLINNNDNYYLSDTPVLLINGYFANGRLVGDVSFTENIKVFPWQGIPQSGFSTIDAINNDSELNFLVEGDWDQIEVFTYEDDVLTPFGKGEIDNIGYIQKGRIQTSIKSIIDKLNVALPTDNFDPVAFPDNVNEQMPIVMGQVNVGVPFLEDVATNKYWIQADIHDVPDVYDQGIDTVAFTKTTNGFTLTSNPVGKITYVAQGFSRAGGGYEEHISEHIPRLLSRINIEYNDTDLDNIYSGITSAWTGRTETVLTAVNELLDGFISYMYPDSSGQLRFGKLKLPEKGGGDIYEREIIGDVKAFKDRANGLSEELLLDRNWSPYQESEIAFAATQANKINLVKEYVTTSRISGLHSFYKDHNVQMKSQALGGTTNGDIILQDIINLWSSPRYFYTLTVVKDLDLNTNHTVTHTQKGLENGKDLLVVSKKRRTRTNKVEYKFWG